MLTDSELKYSYHIILLSWWFPTQEFNIQIIIACISKCHSAQIKDPLVGGVLLLRTHLRFTHLLSDVLKNYRGVQEHQPCVPLSCGNTTYIWCREWGRQERNRAPKRADLKWQTPPPSENCLKYWALSSCLCFLMWRGAKWKTAFSGASFLHATHHDCNRNLHHMGSQVIIFWILKWRKEKC